MDFNQYNKTRYEEPRSLYIKGGSSFNSPGMVVGNKIDSMKELEIFTFCGFLTHPQMITFDNRKQLVCKTNPRNHYSFGMPTNQSLDAQDNFRKCENLIECPKGNSQCFKQQFICKDQFNPGYRLVTRLVLNVP